MGSIDEDLKLILAGGAKKKKTKSAKKQVNNKNKKQKSKSTKQTKSKTKTQKVFIEAGKLIKDTDSEILIDPMPEQVQKQNKKLQQRPRVVKKSADENKEYISVKTEKTPKSDNTYKPYDIAFLKRLQKSKAEIIMSDEDSDQ